MGEHTRRAGTGTAPMDNAELLWLEYQRLKRTKSANDTQAFFAWWSAAASEESAPRPGRIRSLVSRIRSIFRGNS